MKRCQMPVVIREIQIRITQYHCNPTRVVIILARMWKIGGIVIWFSCFENSLEVPQMLNIVITWPSSSTLRYVPKRTKNLCPHGNLYMNVHKSIICNCQKVGTTPMSISWWMDNQMGSAGCNMDKSWKHFCQTKKDRYKRPHLIWFNYEMSKIDKSIETESRLVAVRGRGMGSDC